MVTPNQPPGAPPEPSVAHEPNPYAAPNYGGQPVQSDFHEEVTATEPTGMVKAAGGLQAATGLMLACAGIQLKLVGLIGKPWVQKVPWLMILAGVVAIFFAIKIFKTRGWAALGGTVLNGAILVGMGMWVLASFASGFFSLIATLVPMLALVGTIFGALAIGPCLRASMARRKLRDAGIDMSF